MSELVKGIKKVKSQHTQRVSCSFCEDTGTVLIRCHHHGDISHAEQCICQYERELNFMNIHAITTIDYSMGNGKVTTWREIKEEE